MRLIHILNIEYTCMYITFVPHRMIRFRVVEITYIIAKIECHDIRPNTIVPGKLVCSIKYMYCKL
jgi:hypothetical protein